MVGSPTHKVLSLQDLCRLIGTGKVPKRSHSWTRCDSYHIRLSLVLKIERSVSKFTGVSASLGGQLIWARGTLVMGVYSYENTSGTEPRLVPTCVEGPVSNAGRRIGSL